MSHTPGPWNVVSHNWHETGVYGADQLRVCKLDTEDWGVDEETEDEFGQKQAANARLIAAAPELLDFAQFILRGLDSGHIKAKAFLDFDKIDAKGDVPMHSVASLARAVIDKATGKPA